MLNSTRLGYKDNPKLKCSACGTLKNVGKVIHIPLANGRVGHISLTKWTNYCPDCLKAESVKYDEIFSAAIAKDKLEREGK